MKNDDQINSISIFEEFLKKVNSEVDIRTKFKKNTILILIATGMSIFYMIYDSLQIFQRSFSKNTNFTRFEYELLYTITHLIPIFASPFYGIFTDLYSVRNTYLLCFSSYLLTSYLLQA